MGTCLTCRFWSQLDPVIYYCADVAHDCGDGHELPHGKCVRIIHGNKGRVQGSVDEPAMVLDGSGYSATLRTLPTFGCSLHEAQAVA